MNASQLMWITTESSEMRTIIWTVDGQSMEVHESAAKMREALLDHPEQPFMQVATWNMQDGPTTSFIRKDRIVRVTCNGTQPEASQTESVSEREDHANDIARQIKVEKALGHVMTRGQWAAIKKILSS